jgi:tRNA A-37 threonylcarbamoyl transferase component Bud32
MSSISEVNPSISSTEIQKVTKKQKKRTNSKDLDQRTKKIAKSTSSSLAHQTRDPLIKFIKKTTQLGVEVSMTNGWKEIAKILKIKVSFEKIVNKSNSNKQERSLNLELLDCSVSASGRVIHEACDRLNKKDLYSVILRNDNNSQSSLFAIDKEVQFSYSICEMIKDNLEEISSRVGLTLEEARKRLAAPIPCPLLEDTDKGIYCLMPLQKTNLSNSLFMNYVPLTGYKYLQSLFFTVALLHEGGFFHGNLTLDNVSEQSWETEAGCTECRCYLTNFSGSGILSDLKKTGLSNDLLTASQSYVHKKEAEDKIEERLLKLGNAEWFVQYKQSQDCYALASITKTIVEFWVTTSFSFLLPDEVKILSDKLNSSYIHSQLFSNSYNLREAVIESNEKINEELMYTGYRASVLEAYRLLFVDNLIV